MSWAFAIGDLDAVQTVRALATTLAKKLSQLSQRVKTYEPVADLKYGASVRVPGDADRLLRLRVTNASAFTIENPDRPKEGVALVIDLFNDSGGALGTITWGSDYTFTTTFTAPTNGNHAIVTFYRSIP